MDGTLKSLLSLWENLVKNQRYARFYDSRDVNTVINRATNEGLSFLTKTLPAVGKALDGFHAHGAWRPPPNFTVRSDGYPVFLGNPIKLAIEGDSQAVDYVRQVSLIFYKLETPYDQQLVSEFLEQFKNTDRNLLNSYDRADVFTADIVRIARGSIARILCNEDPRDITPCHGSGSTACRTSNSEKYHQLRFYRELDEYYNYAEHFFFSATHLSDDMRKLQESEEREPQARVCLVPKDSRGPRIISCEPAELMFIQQGIMRRLYKILESHPLTTGQINFADQSINRNLAKTGSVNDQWATLDLTDASDRVSLRLVEDLFPRDWFECLRACRSTTTQLPNGEVVELNKFAPMGSSVCFPVEAMVFWAVAHAAIVLQQGCSSPEVIVYGDDIIVESSYYDSVVRGLTSVGLLVNLEKSYREGPFRESCGGDYHNGVDVTPIRIKKVPMSIKGADLATCADLANSYIAKFGMQETDGFLRAIEELTGYCFPRTQLALPCTLRLNPSASNDVLFRRRWNHSLQRFEYRCLTTSTRVRSVKPPDWGELLRKECTREIRSGIPGEVRYGNELSVTNANLLPGWYADDHSVRTKWQWIWLG